MGGEMGLVIPAVDIMGGKAVRLLKGDYDSKTVYGDPVEIANKFKDMGAEYLHIVDLDGAKGGAPCNFEIIKSVGGILPVQVGGGVRTAETVEEYLQIADRVILGTVAVQNPEFVRAMVDEYGAERIIVGVDVKSGKAATQGWLENSGVDYLEFIEKLKQIGVKIIIVTDISRDGTLTSPNWEVYERISGINVIVSGGVACNDDVLKAKNYCGVIVGKAYYEGKVDLEWLLRNV
jgi:phosphoribosylformimino-5-aminoimidazole carboxamide ribotide isomerase